METLTTVKTSYAPEAWGMRSGALSNHGFEYYDIAVKGGEIRSKHALPAQGEATLDQVFRNNRSFLQIFGRNGAESSQVATVSFGLSGGVETIDKVAENIVEGLGNVEIRHYGVDGVKNQINIFVEADDLDPMFMLGKMVDAPIDVYANIQGLKAQVEAQKIRRQVLLESDEGKGVYYENIFYDLIDGGASPLEVVDETAEFAWGYKVIGNELWNQGCSMTSLAMDSRVDSGMRDSLLDAQYFMANTPEGKMRFVFRVDGHPTTEECCPRATNFQMGEANFINTDKFVDDSINIRRNQVAIFGTDIGIPASYKKESSNKCYYCQKSKSDYDGGDRCRCGEKDSD